VVDGSKVSSSATFGSELATLVLVQDLGSKTKTKGGKKPGKPGHADL
jgi:hypothetical protein